MFDLVSEVSWWTECYTEVLEWISPERGGAAGVASVIDEDAGVVAVVAVGHGCGGAVVQAG